MAAPNVNWGEITASTLNKRRRAFADNVLNHNSLLRELNQRGNIDLVDGGESLVEEIEYAENQTFMWYTDYEAFDISEAEPFSAAEFSWKQAACSVSMSGKKMRQNSGQPQMIRLLRAKIRNAEKTMMNNISTGVYSDGTGSSGKQIGGLQLLVADDPTTGTVGGIDRAAQSFWRNISYDASTDGGAAASASNIQAYMNAVWIQLVRGSDRPRLITADSNYFRFFWESLQAIQRIADARDGESGFESLRYYGPGGSARVNYDDTCPTNHMYFLNTDYIFHRVHRDANMEPLMRREPVQQDAIVQPIIFMGNLTLANAALQGVLKD